ncbi:MAG: glycoside hydrolase family 47 protein, partial [Candidatus Angelobacter sp.]
MRRLLHAVLVVFFAAAPGAFAAPQAKSASPNPGPMARQVRSEFLYSWNAYKQYAWGHDELKPLTQSYRDWYDKPLQMTAVDALDTLVLMGLTDEADKTREQIVKNLSFNQDIYVSNFEITIRLLGGLLSGYQFTGDHRLLDMAQDLGTRLLPAFK